MKRHFFFGDARENFVKVKNCDNSNNNNTFDDGIIVLRTIPANLTENLVMPRTSGAKQTLSLHTDNEPRPAKRPKEIIDLEPFGFDNIRKSKEEYEQKLMRENCFNLCVAVCNIKWDVASQATIGQLDAIRLAIRVEGEKRLERLFGGCADSNFDRDRPLGPQIIQSRSTSRLSNSLSSSCSSTDSNDGMQPVTEDNQWIVEKVLKKRVAIADDKRTISYYLKWEGWDYSFCSWEEHDENNKLGKLIKRFERRFKWRKAIYERESHGMLNRNNRFCFTYMNWIYNRTVFFACHRWEDEMNHVIQQWEKMHKCKQAPVYVENWVDDDVPPSNFQFILDNAITSHAKRCMDGFLKLEFCMCKVNGYICGDVDDCCSELFGQNYCYDEENKLDVNRVRQNWIIECTDGCACDINCPSRVVQRGRQIPIVIFRTTDRGWSLRTIGKIERHQFVCEYVGEILTVDDAFVSTRLSTYQFQMDGAGEHKLKFVVDAFTRGNESRFINHSCSPNSVVRAVLADRFDECYHRIAIFAKRDIKSGEELTIDYCAIDGNAKSRQKVKCNCRASKCRGFFYY